MQSSQREGDRQATSCGQLEASAECSHQEGDHRDAGRAAQVCHRIHDYFVQQCFTASDTSQQHAPHQSSKLFGAAVLIRHHAFTFERGRNSCKATLDSQALPIRLLMHLPNLRACIFPENLQHKMLRTVQSFASGASGGQLHDLSLGMWRLMQHDYSENATKAVTKAHARPQTTVRSFVVTVAMPAVMMAVQSACREWCVLLASCLFRARVASALSMKHGRVCQPTLTLMMAVLIITSASLDNQHETASWN